MDPAAFQFLTGRPWGQADQERNALAGYVDGLAADNRRREEERNARIREALGHTWPAQMVKSAVSAMALPGDVYAGRVDPNSDEAIGRSADLAGLLTFGAGAVPGYADELRAGFKLRGGGEPPPTELGWWFRDVKQKPTLTRAENVRFSAGATSHDGDGVVVPVRSLYATQPRVNPDFAETTTSAGELPYVFRKGGEMYVSDGHHRIARAVQEGSENVRVRLLDLDGRDTSTPLLDWRPQTQAEIDEINELYRLLYE